MGIINPVGARLTETQLRRLEASDDTLRVQPNRAAGVSAVKKDKKPSKVTKTLGSEKAATGSGEDDQYDAAAAWEAAEQRSLQITGDWKIAARQAVKDAGWPSRRRRTTSPAYWPCRSVRTPRRGRRP